jgi:protein gp37
MRICRLAHKNWFPRVRVSSTLTIGRDSLDLPRMIRERTHIFTMPAPGPDLFLQSDDFIKDVFKVMNEVGRHEFQVVTRHVDRAARIADKVSWGPNIWLGFMVEGAEVGDKIAQLRDIPAEVHFAHIKGAVAIPAFDVGGLNFVVVENAVEPVGFHELEESCANAGARLFLGPRVAEAEQRAPTATSTALVTTPTLPTRRR